MEDQETEVGLPKLRRTLSPAFMPPRPMELGKIKIGGKGEKRTSAGGKEWNLPVKFDHFVITGRVRGEDGNFLPDLAVHKKVGPEPEALDIRLGFDRLEENFQSEMLVYDGKKKVFSCDGENAINLKRKTSGSCKRGTESGCQCKPFGRIAVILEASPQYGGFYFLRTTSWETINNLQTTLRIFEAQFGSLRGLPLRLVIYPATDTHDQGVSTSWKVGVVLRADYEEARAAALSFHQSDQIERHELKLLSAGLFSEMHETEAAEAEDIVDEFLVDPLRREEADRIRETEAAKGATEDKIREIRDKLSKPVAAVDDGETEGPNPEDGKTEVELPNWNGDEEEPTKETGINALACKVEFGKYKKLGLTWGQAFEEDPSALGYIKHFILEQNYQHPTLTEEVKDGLRAECERRSEEPVEASQSDEEPSEDQGDGEEAPLEPEGEDDVLSRLFEEAEQCATDLAKLGELDPKDADEIELLKEEGDREGLARVRDRLRLRVKELKDGGADLDLGI